ncbi:MAG: methylmalonyl-CoA mutase family protein [Candidatus Cloacimonetes bacterium]|nr:methylmalonyl-CoA mutase family protein [Candidatus Cloacimonadota bacterium]
MENENKLNLKESFPIPSYEEWLKAVNDTLKGADFDKVMKTKTYEGITLQPIYRKEDIADLAFTDCAPGAAPYLRGNNPQRFLDEGWLIAQSYDESDCQKLNTMLRHDLQNGLTAVNLSLKHEDTKRGVTLRTIDDLRIALKGVDLQAAPLFMQMDISDSYILVMFEQYCKEQNIPLATLEVGLGFDPTSEFARIGSVYLPLDEFWKLEVDIVKWALEKAPKMRVLSLDGSVYEASGASSTQELGFVLSTAIGLIHGLQQSGFTIDQLAPLFQVKLSLGSNFFMEIAKIRAFRLMWAEMIKAFGGSEPSQKVWIHGKTASFNKSIFDNYVNVLRTSTEGFSGVIGGVDSLEIGCFDELVSVPDEFSRRMARNQQVILKEEAHFGKVVDPAGGCYYIESLTAELANKAWETMQELENAGGMIRSLITGKIHDMIEAVAEARIDAVHKRKNVFIGVNMFANPLEKTSQRDTDVIAEVRTRAVSLDKGALPHRRAVEKLELLREQISRTSQNMKVFLVNMGTIDEYKARADFAAGFLQVGGFEVISPGGFASVAEAVKAAVDSNAAAYCICSTDDNYQHLVPELCSALKGKTMILAGYPTELVQNYKEKVINLFIHLRADVYDTLADLAILMGVK